MRSPAGAALGASRLLPSGVSCTDGRASVCDVRDASLVQAITESAARSQPKSRAGVVIMFNPSAIRVRRGARRARVSSGFGRRSPSS